MVLATPGPLLTPPPSSLGGLAGAAAAGLQHMLSVGGGLQSGAALVGIRLDTGLSRPVLPRRL